MPPPAPAWEPGADPPPCAYCGEALGTVVCLGHDAYLGEALCTCCYFDVMSEAPVLPGAGRRIP